VKGLVSASGAGGAAAPALLAVSSAGTALLLAHLLRVLHGSPGDPHAHPPRAGEVLPYAALVAAALGLPLALGAPPAFDGTGLWTLALGVAAAAAFWSFPAPAVPAGDLLALYLRAGRRVTPSFTAPPPAAGAGAGDWLGRAGAWARRAEERLGRDGGRGLAFVALLVALNWLLLAR
jgi:hypothetical protein